MSTPDSATPATSGSAHGLGQPGAVAPHHVVLGATGVIGRETVHALSTLGGHSADDLRITAVSRTPGTAPTPDPVATAAADLLSPTDLDRVLRDADVAYLVAGLPYSTRTWQEQWPTIVRNTATAALHHGVHLVHLDNVYAYGATTTPMTEDTPVAPSSRKGLVRAEALRILEGFVQQGLVLTTARSADFYGPGATTSVFNNLALAKIARGKVGTWMLDADQPHAMTYTPDIGRALAVLGTDTRARGGVWHLPTAPALTGREYVRIAAGPQARTATMSCTALRIGALFNAGARASVEMAYQYTGPHLFDSSRFEETFGVRPTSYQDGISAALAALRA